jgi:hypothetical protein
MTYLKYPIKTLVALVCQKATSMVANIVTFFIVAQTANAKTFSALKQQIHHMTSGGMKKQTNVIGHVRYRATSLSMVVPNWHLKFKTKTVR